MNKKLNISRREFITGDPDAAERADNELTSTK